MTITDHHESRYPAPCQEMHTNNGGIDGGEARWKATCTVEMSHVDNYHTMTTVPHCFCRQHCPVCSPAKKD